MRSRQRSGRCNMSEACAAATRATSRHVCGASQTPRGSTVVAGKDWWARAMCAPSSPGGACREAHLLKRRHVPAPVALRQHTKRGQRVGGYRDSRHRWHWQAGLTEGLCRVYQNGDVAPFRGEGARRCAPRRYQSTARARHRAGRSGRGYGITDYEGFCSQLSRMLLGQLTSGVFT